MTELHNWSIQRDSSPYKAPELVRCHLKGTVYGYPDSVRFPDGSQIHTSSIEESNGRIIKCYSREYLLVGPPATSYIEWCQKNNIELDPNDPFKSKRV